MIPRQTGVEGRTRSQRWSTETTWKVLNEVLISEQTWENNVNDNDKNNSK